MKDWFNKMRDWLNKFCNGYVLFGIVILLVYFFIALVSQNLPTIVNKQWGGYCPMAVYQIFDKETGVYYAVTSRGGICPMYTIEGEVKLVDQGNEYVVHKNLGEPNAQE